MGIRASFQVIRPEIFERLIGGTGPILVDGEERHSIDKAWREFHSVFKTLGPPLSLAITGDHRRPECPQTFEEFRAGSDEYYIGLVSPNLVREVAAALSTLTLEEYKRLDHELHHQDFSFGDRCLPILNDVYASGRTGERNHGDHRLTTVRKTASNTCRRRWIRSATERVDSPEDFAMGIRASLKVIPPDLFERWIAGSEENSGGPGESIDKAWSEFHKVFASLGSPLSLAITGDHRHPVCPQTYDEFRAGEHEIYMGLVSPDLVREIAEALSKLTLEEYKRRVFELHGEDFCFGDYYLTTLKAVYANAASQGNAIVVLIC